MNGQIRGEIEMVITGWRKPQIFDRLNPFNSAMNSIQGIFI